ncbi:fatty acid CoA ligase family protein [Lentzea jiangxiensis]|uniref:Acyl-CoA synthetase (AMP-forming)/AMP-acid ligase II n=1 Tax=Lentzea jiangxiensis TaxID=641025 RepID=A0A1H0X5B6_9PSEU|nr:fatty acid CoA ligase family protein [Lentzea jiangxiensis]SDP98138.1 Acyl-CoA synthetase (AMP-forming)/AMP-acid ligase II [Lentzea jiangxiensis]
MTSARSCPPPEETLLFSRFAEIAERTPDAIAMRYPVGRGGYASITHRDLVSHVDSCERALWHAGLRPGMRTVLLAPAGPDCTALLLAIGRIGAVPVLIDPAIGPRALSRCVAATAAEAFIGVPRAHLARKLLGWPPVKVSITVGRRWFWRGHTLAGLLAADAPKPPAPAEPGGLIAFTSGSTGPAKPVEYRAEHLSAQIRMASAVLDVRVGTPCLITFAPFVVAGPSLGWETVVPDVDLLRPATADPVKLIEAIRRFGVECVFTSPAALEVLSRYCTEHGIVLEQVRKVACIGASLDPRLARRLRRCLHSDAVVHSIYGATECLPVSVIESRELLDNAMSSERGHGTCLGRPVEDNAVRVITVTDEPIDEWYDGLEVAAGVVGEITVTGPSTSESYVGQPDRTRLAKIREGDRVVHRVGDLGHLDEQGSLWFHGRKSHRVRTATGDLITEQVEPIANAVAGVRRSALVGVGATGAQMPVLCLEAESGVDRAAVERAVRAVLAGHPHTAAIDSLLFHRRFPVDPRHNSKIVREELALWAARRLR